MGLILDVLNPHMVEISSVVIHWYGVIIATGILAALQLSTKEAEKKGLEEDTIIDTALWAILIRLLGARFYYVLFGLGYYLQNPGQILAIWSGGIAIYEGLIAEGGTLYWYAKRKGTSLALVLDILTPNVLLAQSIGCWDNFMNQEAHGGPVTRQSLENLCLPEFIIKQMNISGTYYHPTFLYKSLWSLLGFVLIVIIRSRKQLLYQGKVALSYVLWYSVGRFFIEGIRTDSLWIDERVRVSQALSLTLFIDTVVVWFIRRQNYPPISCYSDGSKG